MPQIDRVFVRSALVLLLLSIAAARPLCADDLTGKVEVMTTPPVAAHRIATLQEPTPSPVVVNTRKPTPGPSPAGALTATLPFLRWIGTHPQLAVDHAAGAGMLAGPADTPYWLPPLIDAPSFWAGSVGGSAATDITSRP